MTMMYGHAYENIGVIIVDLHQVKKLHTISGEETGRSDNVTSHGESMRRDLAWGPMTDDTINMQMAGQSMQLPVLTQNTVPQSNQN